MAFRCCSLGSGSKGNATLIVTETTRLLVDCGFGLKESQRRMSEKGIQASELDGILVTHEHGDHAGGVASLSNKFSIPVWLTRGSGIHASCSKIKQHRWLEADQKVVIGDIEVTPYTVPHDAREPVQFVFNHQDKVIGLLTDVGHITNNVTEMVSACHVLLLEFNYDSGLLSASRYPESLKRRISGAYGHLGNHQSVALIQKQTFSNLQSIVGMHLSEENNCADIVRDSIESNLDSTKIMVHIADQQNGFDWVAVNEDMGNLNEKA